MRPIDVIPRNAMKVWRHVYGDSLSANKQTGYSRNPPPVHPPDTLVRIARERGAFHKGYLPTFSEEIYRVNKVKSALKPTTYEIIDDADRKPLKGRFYDRELSKTTYKMFRVEKELGKRTLSDGTEQVKVKIYGTKEPYWVNVKDVTQFEEDKPAEAMDMGGEEEESEEREIQEQQQEEIPPHSQNKSANRSTNPARAGQRKRGGLMITRSRSKRK